MNIEHFILLITLKISLAIPVHHCWTSLTVQTAITNTAKKELANLRYVTGIRTVRFKAFCFHSVETVQIQNKKNTLNFY
jgi:hypothetical protein